MKTKQLLLLLAALLPIGAWAEVWQDPETKINYWYDSGSGKAHVLEGSSNWDLNDTWYIPGSYVSV